MEAFPIAQYFLHQRKIGACRKETACTKNSEHYTAQFFPQ